MNKSSEYHKHANECRKLAKSFPPGMQRDSLEAMAASWDKMADERRQMYQIEDIEREETD